MKSWRAFATISGRSPGSHPDVAMSLNSAPGCLTGIIRPVSNPHARYGHAGTRAQSDWLVYRAISLRRARRRFQTPRSCMSPSSLASTRSIRRRMRPSPENAILRRLGAPQARAGVTPKSRCVIVRDQARGLGPALTPQRSASHEVRNGFLNNPAASRNRRRSRRTMRRT